MSLSEWTIQVSYRHRVVFTRGAWRPAEFLLPDLLSEGALGGVARVWVALDDGLVKARPTLPSTIRACFEAWSRKVMLLGDPLVLPGGERAKNSFDGVASVHEALHRHGVDRHAYAMAVGGGAFLDMVGFGAATAHRGVRHVRCPTTTLSQADSGVGVKNGINAFGKKNFIGTFAPPFAVINDVALLDTLPPRVMRDGLIEAVKVALIRDASFLDSLERRAEALARFDPQAIEWAIERCARLHVEHIVGGGDPFEFGSARPLDFGHWAAHKLESLSHHRLSHGEAVAVGIALDVVYSRRKGYLGNEQAERVLNLISALGFELYAAEMEHRNGSGQRRLLDGLEEFREHLGGSLSLTMLHGPGQAFEVNSVDPAIMNLAIDELRDRMMPPEP